MPFATYTDLRYSTAEILGKIEEEEAHYIITKRGVPLACLVPFKDLSKIGKEKFDQQDIEELNAQAISLGEASRKIGSSPSTVRKLIDKGIIKGFIKKGKICIPINELDRIRHFKSNESTPEILINADKQQPIEEDRRKLNDEKPMLSIEEVSKLVGVPINHVLEWVFNGKLKLTNTQNGYKIHEEELNKLIKFTDTHIGKNIDPNENECNLEQACKLLGMTKSNVLNYVNQGKLKATILDGNYFFDLSELKRFANDKNNQNKASEERIAELLNKKTLSIAEACVVLGITRTIVYKRIAKGEIDVIKFGGISKISIDEIIRFKQVLLKEAEAEKSMLTFKEAAKLLGIGEVNLRRLIRAKDIKPVYFGRKGHRISQEALDSFIKKTKENHDF